MIVKTLKSSFATWLVALGIVVVASACSTVNPTSPVASQDYDVACIKDGEKMLAAYADNDEKTFLALLPANVLQQFTAESFKSTRTAMDKALGSIIHYEYITKLEGPLLTLYLYRVRFRRDSVNPEGVKTPIEQEVLFRVVFAPLDQKPHVVSFGFL